MTAMAPFRALVLTAILLAAVPMPATAQGTEFTVSGLTPTSLRLDTATSQTFAFTVTNADANADNAQMDSIKVSIPQGTSEPFSIQSATAVGWTATVSDVNAAGGNEQVVFTPNGGAAAGLDPGASLDISVQVLVSSSATDGQTVTVTAEGTDDTALTTAFPTTFGIKIQALAIVVSETAVFVAEPAGTDTFTVALSHQPSSAVVLSTSTSGPASAAPAKLTFGTGNWSTPQTVTVTAQDDSVQNAASRVASVVVAVVAAQSDDSYDTVPSKSVGVTVIDDDENGITFTHSNGVTQVVEGGTDTFTVRLDAKPASSVVLDLTVSIPSEATLDKTSLTFSSSNWNIPQTVTITAIDDAIQDGALSTSISVIASVRDAESDDAYDGVADASMPATVIDNDRAGILVEESGGSTVVGESAGDRTDTFTVRLTGQPASAVQITASALVPDTTTASDDVSMLPNVLLFSTQNWNVPQTITITAVDDTITEGTEVVTIVLAVASGSSPEYLSLANTVFAATINDDDEAGLVVTTPDPFATSENAGTTSFQVKLARKPVSNVVINLGSADTGEVELTSGATLTTPVGTATRFLTFTPSNWNVDQTVNLLGKDDSLQDGHQDVAIILSVDDAKSDDRFDGVADVTVTVTNKDDEATVMARPSVVHLGEGETTAYNVSLSIKPATSVTVTVNAASGITPSPRTLTFTPSDWETAQSVRITVADNKIIDGDRERTVSHSVSSTDIHYNKAESVTVAITDDDTFDIEQANEDLQDSVQVERDGDENVVTWDIGDVDGDPAGVQIWRALSPFELIETFDNETSEYDDEEFRDKEDKDAKYIVTVYYGATEELGFFTDNDDITDVLGYIDLSDDELDDLAVAADTGALDTGVIVGIVILAIIVIAAVIVAIVIISRRRKEDDEWDDEWEDSDDPATQVWSEAGWQVERGPKPWANDGPTPPVQAAAGSHDDGWEDWDDWSESPAEGAPTYADDWTAPEAHAPEAHAPEAHAPEAHAPEAHAPEAHAPEAGAPTGWDDEWAEPAPEPVIPDNPETFHLTCPSCRHDFTARGQRPLVTHCPNCGVEGVLR